jgi:lipoprotein-anchoring transpeptidase ErfK/SrfK
MTAMSRKAVALSALAVAAAGCGGTGADARESAGGASGTSPSSPRPASSAPAAARPSEPGCEPGATRSYAADGVAAVLQRRAVAYRVPGGQPVATFSVVNVNKVPTTFRVLEAQLGRDCRPAWYRVQLPIRPNGTEGWILANAARRYRVDFRIVVDLSDREVTVYRAGKPLVRTPAAIGRPETPTPTGSFYVNQRLLAADPAGPWGPGGIGISAFSPTLGHWRQGGPIAIHGTNEPETIGQVVSNGCLRIDNDVLERLIHVVPDGTPVHVRQ